MASTLPFNIANSPSVASIPCTACGNNMQCIGRFAEPAGERQQFRCAACGRSVGRVVGLQESDDAVQAGIEAMFGIARTPA